MFGQMRGKRAVYKSPLGNENGEGKERCIQIWREKVRRRLPEVTSSQQAMVQCVTGIQLMDLPPLSYRDVWALPMLCQLLHDLYPPLHPCLVLVVVCRVHVKNKKYREC